MTAGRLRVLLAHHEPEEALAVAAGRAAPHPAVAPMLTGGLAVAWARSASRRPVEEWSDAVRSLRHRRRDRARQRLPGGVAHRSTTSRRAVRARRLVGAGSSARGHRRDPQRHWSRPSVRRHARVPPCEQRRGGGVRAGQGDRRRRSPWSAARRIRTRRRRRRQRSRHAVPAGQRRSLGRRGGERAVAVRVAARHRTGAVQVPAAQPHPRRPQRTARGGREPRARWIADDRPRGVGAGDRGDGGARVGQQPRRCRDEPVDPRWCDARDRRR